MKPSPPLQFPEAAKPTSLHGVPVRSRPIPDPVSRTGNRHRMHGAPCTSAHVSPGFPSEPSAAAQVPAQPNPIRRSVSRGEQRTRLHRRPIRVELASSPRLPGSTVRDPRYGLLALMMPAVFARFPERRSPASRARGPSTNTASSHSFPCAHAVLVARLPMLGGTHFA